MEVKKGYVTSFYKTIFLYTYRFIKSSKVSVKGFHVIFIWFPSMVTSYAIIV